MRWSPRAVVLGLIGAAALVALNFATLGLGARIERWKHDRTINAAGYKRQNGHWDRVTGPNAQQIDTVHMAVLRTGRVLLIAGSGNDQQDFDAGVFQIGIFDPATGATRVLRLPTDIFCAGQAFLADGRLLIAGGTGRYEELAQDVTRAGGVLSIPPRARGLGTVRIPAGTRFVSPAGLGYRTRDPVRVGRGTARVWVQAERQGDGAVVDDHVRLVEDGSPAPGVAPFAGVADRLTRETIDAAGMRTTYVFDPVREAFTRLPDMHEHRWYPSLVMLADGRVVAVSGLDQFGRILPGANEIFDPATGRWTLLPHRRKFATYPALFPTARPGTLFFAGSNSGYGLDDEGRTPGLWDPLTDAYRAVPGLRDADMTETSGSVLLPPANAQRVMILGGGGVGESPRATARTAIVDLKDPSPRYHPGPSLPAPTRYPNAVILPDDSTLVTGGARNYRARGDSAELQAMLLDPSGRTLRRVADPTIKRSYHSSAVLLPDGRVLTAGGDPVENPQGTGPGTFEKRMEIYSPPYLFRGPRPVVTAGPSVLARGATGTFATPDAAELATARLIRPAAVTHTTDLEQRSVALGIRRRRGAVDLTVPRGAGLTPPGWYMLFVVDRDGVPSVARWVRVP